MLASLHTPFLLRTLDLARLGGIKTAPNPMVGCVIVHEGKIIGEGYHEIFGGPHAEVNAIHSVADKELLKKSTVYVSLEPCNHHGKTPPCTELLIHHKIPHVVVGCTDPDARVSGTGIQCMKDAGIRVELASNPQPFRELNKAFFVNQILKRPFITLKWAETADGFIAGMDTDGNPHPLNISSVESNRLMHRIRAERQAILIGRKTAEIDDPRLDTRLFSGPSPIKIILDPDLKTKLASNLFQGARVIWVNKIQEKMEGNVHYFKADSDCWKNSEKLLQALYGLGISSILVEGGAFTLQKFIDSGVWDEGICIQSPLISGTGTKAPEQPHDTVWTESFTAGPDQIKVIRNSFF